MPDCPTVIKLHSLKLWDASHARPSHCDSAAQSGMQLEMKDDAVCSIA